MKSIFIVFILLLTTLISACRSSQEREIEGCYVSQYDTTQVDVFPCHVQVKNYHNFLPTSFISEVDLSATFSSNNEYTFPEITIDYHFYVDGKWEITEEGKLHIAVDTTSFTSEFVGSSAQNGTERVFERQLRREVIHKDLIPRIKKEILLASEGGIVGQRTLRVLRSNNSELVLLDEKLNQNIVLKKLK